MLFRPVNLDINQVKVFEVDFLRRTVIKRGICQHRHEYRAWNAADRHVRFRSDIGMQAIYTRAQNDFATIWQLAYIVDCGLQLQGDRFVTVPVNTKVQPGIKNRFRLIQRVNALFERVKMFLQRFSTKPLQIITSILISKFKRPVLRIRQAANMRRTVALVVLPDPLYRLLN